MERDLSGLELMELQASVLYCYDERGRMLRVNEPGEEPVPRLFLGRTRLGNLWRVRHDLPDTLAEWLEQQLRTEPVASDFDQPAACLDVLREQLEEHAPVTGIYQGPAWRFPEEVPASTAVRVTSANARLLRPHFAGLEAELLDRGPCTAVAVEGQAVSVCFCSRRHDTAAEAGLYTVEGFRGRGYAVQVVAAWALAVRESGRVPLYSTSWDNAASRAVARKLDLVLYGEDLSID